MDLDKISVEDKLWVFTRNIVDLKSIQREFAFMCAARVVEGCDVQEVKDYFTLILFIYESGELGLLYSEEYSSANNAAYWAADWTAFKAAGWAVDRAAYCAAYWAADRAADRAANRATERDIQVEMIKYLLERSE